MSDCWGCARLHLQPLGAQLWGARAGLETGTGCPLTKCPKMWHLLISVGHAVNGQREGQDGTL
jgi:hypothetical protein